MHKKITLREVLQTRRIPELKAWCVYFDVGSLRAGPKGDKLFLMDKDEFQQKAMRLVTSAWVDFASLVSCAKLCGITVADLFHNRESTIFFF